MQIGFISATASRLRLTPCCKRLLIFGLAFVFALGITAEAAPKNVLVLSGGRGRDSINRMEFSVRAHFHEPINFSIVDLDNSPFEQNSYEDHWVNVLSSRYSGEKLDLVVAVMFLPSLQFALKYRERLFPGVPIVFMSDDLMIPDKMWPGVTGVESYSGIRGTIELALRLHPDTQAIAIVTDSNDHLWLPAEHAQLLRYGGKVKEIDLLGPPSPDLLKRVAELPPHTVVLYQLYARDLNQPAFGPADVLAAIAPRVPIYSILPPYVGNGAIGSTSYNPVTDAVMAGELAARVLSGERPDDIPPAQNSSSVITVDWRQLRRWNIPESALPPGTVVLFREPTLWERGRKYFLAGIAVIAVQFLLIFTLFWQRARRRRAEIELARSEQKFSKAFRQSPLAITIVGADDGCYIDVNEAFEVHTGWKRDEVIGRSPIELNLWVDADQRTAFMGQLSASGSVRDLEVRFRTKDGQIRTSLGSAELIDVHGKTCALSVVADITERKQAEEAMAGFSRRLIEAQETERTHIARELHDDINQRLAMIAVGVKTAKQNLSASDSQNSRILQETCQRVSDLESDIQALSHRLHSSKLEYLGLEAAALSFCEEMSKLHNISIDFHCDAVPEDLSTVVSLCLFRVLQEALHNAVKYSGVNECEVSVTGVSNAIELRVYDPGAGFDPKRKRNGHGLGLISMKERLKMVNGEFSIDSTPGHGTTVLARVPLLEDAGVSIESDASQVARRPHAVPNG